jgi:hypothetical protein
MAIELYWDDDSLTRMLCVFDGRWSWNELLATLKTIQQITHDLPHQVDAIIDVRKGAHFPEGLFNTQSLENARGLLKMGEQGTGRLMVVGVNPLIRSIFEAISRLDQRATTHVQFVDSVKQARDLLQERKTA